MLDLVVVDFVTAIKKTWILEMKFGNMGITLG